MSRESSPSWRRVLADVERTTTPKGRGGVGCYSIEGLRLHERALRAGVALRDCLVSESLRDDPRERVAGLLARLRTTGAGIHMAPDAILQRLTEGRGTGAIIGLVPLPQPPALDEILQRRGPGASAILVAADVEDPGNLGALLRTALASGALAAACVGISDPFHPRAVRTSMGSLFKLPVIRYPQPEPLLDRLRGLGVTTLAAVARGGTALPDLPPLAGPLALFVGSEAFGLRGELAAALDLRVTIPMADGVDSFSVNAAAAIVLYEMRRRPEA